MVANPADTLHALVIGAGIGGLACAISLRRHGIRVTVLERAPEIFEIGAGIQVPCNAGRVLQHLDLLEGVRKYGTEIDAFHLRRYSDGKLLSLRPAGKWAQERYGTPWIVIHRADYLDVLLHAAKDLGVEIKLDSEVRGVDFENTQVILSQGEPLKADVIIGADGLWSMTRDQILGHPSPPTETGTLVYRVTLTRADILKLNNPEVAEICSQSVATAWLGPRSNCILYAIKNGEQLNLVLTRPDNLPAGTKTAEGDLQEMLDTIEGWDERLVSMLSMVKSGLKWKLLHHSELEKWTKVRASFRSTCQASGDEGQQAREQGCVALLGDASHPTLPHQSQGAAMAVEDGVVLGILLGRLAQSQVGDPRRHIPDLLQMYERLQKSRSTVNVRGAAENGKVYQLPDGVEQVARDKAFAQADYESPSSLLFCDSYYQDRLLGHDAVSTATRAFEAWKGSLKNSRVEDYGVRHLHFDSVSIA